MTTRDLTSTLDQVGRPKSDGRLRRRLLTYVFVVVGLYLTLVLLVFNPFTGGGSGFTEGGGTIQAEGLPEGAPQAWEYQPGARFTYGFTVRNNGPLPIVVTDIPNRGSFIERINLFLRQPFGYEGTSNEPVPFEPFRLESGDQRDVLVEARVASCRWFETRQKFGVRTGTEHISIPNGALIKRAWERVTFRTLGLPRTRIIELVAEVNFAVRFDPGSSRPTACQ